MKRENKPQKERKTILFTTVVIILVGIIVALLMIVLFTGKDENDKSSSDQVIGYESNVVVDDEEALQDAVDALFAKAKEGQMTLEMKTEAHSLDGKTFSCFLGNSISNNYDMFMVLYRDDTQEEIYRTGLIPMGARIEEFTLDEALESGSYSITIVYNQVEEDHKTIHSQVNVGLTLIVK